MSLLDDVHTSHPAVVLLSGGLDSATVLGLALPLHPVVRAVSFYYGQTHMAELDAARRQIRWQKSAHPKTDLSHVRLELPRAPFERSSLTGQGTIPTEESAGIPSTYVPARNTVFLSLALGIAETINARTIYIGANAIDYSGYPDCRPAYLAAFEHMANLATKAGVEASERGERPPLRIAAPLIALTKAKIVELALLMNVPLAETISCYQATSPRDVCGACDACRIRARAFGQIGRVDPAAQWTDQDPTPAC